MKKTTMNMVVGVLATIIGALVTWIVYLYTKLREAERYIESCHILSDFNSREPIECDDLLDF